jgi:hypothetical protein
MDPEFGARLRAHREARKLTLQGIAAQTKIKQSLLHGLESDDLSAWPKGIFRRAFVRDYARAIGLDPETVVREFLERHPDPVEQTPFGPGGAPLTESDLVQVHSEPPTRLQRLLDAARTAVPTLLNRGDRATRPDVRSHSGRPDLSERRQPPPRFEAIEPPDDGLRLSFEPPPVAASPAAAQRIDTPDESRREVDLGALAALCTRFALVADREQFRTALADTTRILHAVGVMLWCWEPGAALLTPVSAHGYPDAIVARLPPINPQDDNSIADAFRTAATRVVPPDSAMKAAVAVPVLAPAGCVGVLAYEVRDGRERDSTITAAATIIAAQLAALLTPTAEPHVVTA